MIVVILLLSILFLEGHLEQGWPGGGGSGIPKYPKKTFQNTKNYTKTGVKYQNLEKHGILYTKNWL